MGDVLSGEIKKGYGHSQRHLLNKCETGDKNRRESNAETNFREALSSLLYMWVIFFATQRVILPFGQWYCSALPHSDILFALKLAKQISLSDSRISLRSNRTRRRRIELAWYSVKSITPFGQWYCPAMPSSDILFALKLAKQISLGVSRISLRSNRTRREANRTGVILR